MSNFRTFFEHLQRADKTMAALLYTCSKPLPNPVKHNENLSGRCEIYPAKFKGVCPALKISNRLALKIQR